MRTKYLYAAIVLMFVVLGCGKETPQRVTPSQPTPTVTTPAPSSEPDSYSKPAIPATDTASDTVHITRTGKKYHAAGCRYLSKSDIPISRQDAEARGYEPCSKCNP